jgi:hypothetical protein
LVLLLVSSLEVEAAIYPLGVSSKHEIEVSYEITYTTLLAENGESHFSFRYYVTSKVKRDISYRFGLVYTCSDGTKELFVSDRNEYLLIHGKDTITFDDNGVCLGSSIETLKGLIYAVDAPLYI